MRHGLTGQVILVTQEQQAAYEHHCSGFFKDWCPQGATEAHVIQTMADKQWQGTRGTPFSVLFMP